MLSAITALSCPICNFIAKRVRLGRDARTLQMFPDNVLTDMGLEKLEVVTGTNGDREIFVIRHRYG